MMSLRLRAPAKVNLFLKVLGRRPDGFHEIETVVQSVALHDDLELTVGGDGIRLEVDDPRLQADPTNLVWRAARALLPECAPGRGLAMRLKKRIPIAAGLGGGSSDAAAALKGVDTLYSLGLPAETLERHAASLGSDVPYFLVGGTALLKGRGTEVEALPDLPRADLVIASSNNPLPTPLVYAQLQEPLTLAPRRASIRDSGRILADLESLVRLGNDLEPHAERLCAEVGSIRKALLAAGARVAAMSGSGSAVFGVFASAAAAREAAGTLERQGFRAQACATIDRATYQRDWMEH